MKVPASMASNYRPGLHSFGASLIRVGPWSNSCAAGSSLTVRVARFRAARKSPHTHCVALLPLETLEIDPFPTPVFQRPSFSEAGCFRRTMPCRFLLNCSIRFLLVTALTAITGSKSRAVGSSPSTTTDARAVGKN